MSPSYLNILTYNYFVLFFSESKISSVSPPRTLHAPNLCLKTKTKKIENVVNLTSAYLYTLPFILFSLHRFKNVLQLFLNFFSPSLFFHLPPCLNSLPCDSEIHFISYMYIHSTIHIHYMHYTICHSVIVIAA